MPRLPVLFAPSDRVDEQLLTLTYSMEPTAVKFHACNDRVRCIVGPVGSGKSSMAVWELLFRAMQQKVNRNGVRESRWAVIRNTYPDLLNTTLRTFLDWLPHKQYPNLGYSLTVNYSKPMIAKLYLRLPAGCNGHPVETLVDAEFIFLALDDDADIDKLKSLELTGVWVNEASQISKTIFTTLNERIGRFPAKKNGGFNWTGVWMDTNPPDIEHWIVDLFEKEKPVGYTIFHQPPGILELPKKNPMDSSIYVPNQGQGEWAKAENIDNLGEGFDYYLSKTVGTSREYIRVMLMGFYGSIMSGKPVYPEYVDEIHCAKEDLKPYRGMPLCVSFDYGTTPAVVISQLSPRGKLTILDEVVSGLSERELKGKPKDRYFASAGVRNFATSYLIPYLQNHYGGMEIVYTGDPAGSARSQNNETSCIEELRNCGLDVGQARTNVFLPRREAVEAFMLRRDGFQLSPRCIVLREGFQKTYVYTAVNKPNGIAYASEPDKRATASHVHDALQYAALYWEFTGAKSGAILPAALGGMYRSGRREVEESNYGGYV